MGIGNMSQFSRYPREFRYIKSSFYQILVLELREISNGSLKPTNKLKIPQAQVQNLMAQKYISNVSKIKPNKEKRTY